MEPSVPRPSHPAFVANAGEGLVRFVMCSDTAECWVICGGVAHSQKSSEFTTNLSHGPESNWTAGLRQPCRYFFGSESHTTAAQKELPLLHMYTPHPGPSLHVTSFTRPSLKLVLQVTNTGVSEKARVQGYCISCCTTTHVVCAHTCMLLLRVCMCV